MNAEIIKNELVEQKKSKFKGNIYHTTQVLFAYNSNKIEGSRLTEEQTEMIFETRSVIAKEGEQIRADDMIEALNHFRLFDFMLDHYEEPLTKELILKLHKILKRGTSDEYDPRYNVGGFKVLPNIIGIVNVIKTSAPEKVEKDLDSLLKIFENQEKKNIDELIDFHVRFERIHPLSDGNGRVGRILLFKECLRNEIVPFVVLDQDKAFYLRGLREYDRDPIYLKDTCLNEQDIYYSLCEKLLDYYKIPEYKDELEI